MGSVKTFVVRLFVPVDWSPGPRGTSLHGFVEESVTGRKARFDSAHELTRFLAAAAGGRQRPARPSERKAP
jgi:hypothetical protein